jgi:hypothetical protein
MISPKSEWVLRLGSTQDAVYHLLTVKFNRYNSDTPFLQANLSLPYFGMNCQLAFIGQIVSKNYWA